MLDLSNGKVFKALAHVEFIGVMKGLGAVGKMASRLMMVLICTWNINKNWSSGIPPRHFWSNSYIGIIRRMVESPTMSERLPESNVPTHDQTCLPLAHGTVPEFPPCFIL